MLSCTLFLWVRQMYVALPQGSGYGWGIAGQHLCEEMLAHRPLSDVTLHSMKNPDFSPTFPTLWNKHNIGYCFFENDIDAHRYMGIAARDYDVIVAGSSWCEQHLRLGGVRNTATILQGIDAETFYYAPPRVDDSRFIVFSGGKFELRKSQDVVIAAMKIMMQRHADVWLSCAWHNHWPYSIATMSGSPLIQFHMREDTPCDDLLKSVLVDNGIALDRVLFHSLKSNSEMREVYIQSDIGLFPNRCEGGNNMVMSEYMACGRTVIASDKTGHADVVSQQNAFPLTRYKQQLIEMDGRPSALWFQPSVDEVIEQLEYAYQHRDQLVQLSSQAAHDLQQLSWKSAAMQFYQLATEVTECSEVSFQAYTQSAEELERTGRRDLAIARLKQALFLEPANAGLYQVIASLYRADNKEMEATWYETKAHIVQQLQGER